MRKMVHLFGIVALLTLPLVSAKSDPARLFIDLSAAATVDATPTPHSPSSPALEMEAEPGSLVRVSVGMQFSPTSAFSRWYLLSAYLPISAESLTIEAPFTSDLQSNAFWHPDVANAGLTAQAKAAASAQTLPLRDNLLRPFDADFPAATSSGAIWVVLAPGGATSSNPVYIGHCYVRVPANVPDGARLNLRLHSAPDPSLSKLNTLLVTDSSQRYHLIGSDLTAEGATIIVRALRTEIEGHVTLGDFTGSSENVPVTVEVRRPNETAPIWSQNTTLDAAGRFVVSPDLRGLHDLAVKAGHWLRRVIPSVNLSGRVTVHASLMNGDVDGDNEVTLFDFGALVAAFGSLPGDSHWNSNADLDGDEEVTLFDFGILVRNFGAIGDD